jgi:hypothetical protein
VNDVETPGVCEITRAIHRFADGDEDKLRELVDAPMLRKVCVSSFAGANSSQQYHHR